MTRQLLEAHDECVLANLVRTANLSDIDYIDYS